jgi:ubiquinone/menaquinone biosynthesis C-methylase UbiE
MQPEILAFYQQFAEHERLGLGAFRLEFARTKEILSRWIGQPPSVVLDIGGGPGAYAAWLAGLGHEVHLIDAVARHIDYAGTLPAESGGRIASCTVGDARSLDRPDQSADVVLLLGPLYHLIESGDRLAALREARRVLVRGGLLFAGAISRFASVLDGLALDLFRDPAFTEIVANDLAGGVHRNPTGNLQYFTTAYFHRPEELESELAAAGFSDVAVLGLEGPGWLFPDFDERWSDARRREDLLRCARQLEFERSIQAVSAHLLAVGRRGD